jgi:hypothetical protein
VAAEVPVNLRRIGLLFLLVAALGAYLYFYEVPQARKEATKEKLLAVDKDAVTGVSLTFPDREIELRKDDTGWRLVKPVQAPADETTVKSVIATLADAEVQKTLDEAPADLASFGLDKPEPRAVLTLKDGAQSAPVAVGKNTAIGGKTYVRKGDDPKVYLTTSTIRTGLNKQAKDLRDKQLLAFQDDEVSRVEITRAGGTPTTLTRKDKDAWTVDPGGQPADSTEVRSYLASLRAARAVDFPDDTPTDLAQYGLDHPRLSVMVATSKEGSEPKTLLLGGEMSKDNQKHVYAKRSDGQTIYALGEWSYRSLDKNPGQFRDKTILGFDPERVGKVTLERKGSSPVTLSRKDGAWQVEGVEGTPKEPTITRFLADLKDLRGADIAAEPPGNLVPYGLDAPDLRVTLIDKDGGAMGTILAAKREKYYAMREGGPTVFEARDYMFTRLDKQPKDFVETAAAEAGKSPTPATTVTPPPPPDTEDLGDEEDLGEDEDFGEDEHIGHGH